MSLSSFFSSFLSVVHADAPEEPSEQKEAVEATEEVEEPSEEAEKPEAEEEEEEPEDLFPQIREDCQNSAKCAPLTKHFEHCQEKVSSGKGYKGEDCVEELMMHCADACAAPKLFSKLR
ncbi:Non-heme 11 kDa protein of cytochrome bc1 complex [Hygrophoropsis aurantiaca]|uniref:Non-heme 11 kDa protein of cytochrome bc1 complex n=1 Tax=Hygrophoropsis aurantiaca TaxID=72124 RepID=A0ACB8AKV8_9AGAM|nr:Non-heme 11 kDa protein of cytochrome bc1 complex [Hygrophoropsis aurantiaca]